MPTETSFQMREFSSGNGTVRLFLYEDRARLIVRPNDQEQVAFERDYDLDQRASAERDYQTLYRAIWG